MLPDKGIAFENFPRLRQRLRAAQTPPKLLCIARERRLRRELLCQQPRLHVAGQVGRRAIALHPHVSQQAVGDHVQNYPLQPLDGKIRTVRGSALRRRTCGNGACRCLQIGRQAFALPPHGFAVGRHFLAVCRSRLSAKENSPSVCGERTRAVDGLRPQTLHRRR